MLWLQLVSVVSASSPRTISLVVPTLGAVFDLFAEEAERGRLASLE
jgi:hypothetical protein